ncbi:MAG: alpha/beta hydrolase [Pseudomonadota bacterium]
MTPNWSDQNHGIGSCSTACPHAERALGKPEDKKDPRIDLVKAKLAGLPPGTLINAQIDPLRSDGDMLEASLKKAGVKVEHKMYAGTTHQFSAWRQLLAMRRTPKHLPASA